MTELEDSDPVLPYAGTSGWQGSDTSRERAKRQDADGTTALRQRQMLSALRHEGRYGATAFELCQLYNLPTNSVAPSLTILHGDGQITRLKERRGVHEVYVLPEHVDGREESPKRCHGSSDAALDAAYQRGYTDGRRAERESR